MVWGCSHPSSTSRRARLKAATRGVTAQATVGVGVGANVLIGGFDKSITLQPLSVEGNTGLNLAAGIGAIAFAKTLGSLKH